jgi:hypothetical protein
LGGGGGGGGNEAAEAFGVEGRIGDLASVQENQRKGVNFQFHLTVTALTRAWRRLFLASGSPTLLSEKESVAILGQSGKCAASLLFYNPR